MAGQRPKFSLTAGGLTSDSAASVAGPSRFVVQRSLDVPLDGLSVLLAESGGVAAGDPVQLKLGDEDGLEDVFAGTVAEVTPRLGGCRLFCVGKMLDLMELRVSSFYRDQTAGGVVRDLVGQTSLQQGDISDGVSLPRFSVQRRASAHAQLRRLADRLGFSLFSDRTGKIHFRGLGPAAQLGAGGALGGAGAALAGAAAAALGAGGGGIAYGKHLLEAEGGARPALGRKVLVGGESPMSGLGEDKSFWLTATDSDFQGSSGDGAELLVIDPTARTKDMASRFAAGYAASFARRTGEIRLTVQGLPKLELGDSSGATGTPEAGLSKPGYVKGLRHRFGVLEGFVTDIVVSVEGSA